MHRLIVLTDGTGKDGSDGGGRTNVNLLQDFLKNDDNQTVNYFPGLGTRDSETWTGKIFGKHVYRVISEQYRWITRAVESLGIDVDIDIEFALFGFSRGAFISRVLADMLLKCGIPVGGSIEPKEMIDWYKKGFLSNIAEWRKRNPKGTLNAHISFIGVWDTVASAKGFDDSQWMSVPQEVVVARHAVAINENRHMFNYTPMNAAENVRELFFGGCHSDVGGGYDDNPVLSRIALHWMVSEAKDAGVLFDKTPAEVKEEELIKACPHSEQNDESNLLWKDDPIMRHIDLSRLHPSVNLLPWPVILGDGSPVESEKLVAMANRVYDNVASTTMIA